ncbi:MAG: PLP-dependent aminotransferase family protein [Tenuifilum sp.]|uniref:aminotransferase-like domain-containing protein n=1 Tax=Tenuifilum sp. TaxID=2760880 RepID=UPI001B55BEAF|nr:PLP-dependent aminotransferase family protein [Bacteroidales bacterium]HOK86431.1 PLP-dependent aminotransferase family protein [Tenuifilum sp.]HON70546.1 PLP-dependent aminotransferase family protein [Tenuifilum sp.]HOU74561.1 PLP-dependent aminotransferase family protein [Tenuifilum sp.]HQE54668.1 PLP-dependent aminotransferase family protein [Tenuifilum sp.]
MINDLDQILSASAKRMKRSVIRELLKMTQRPELISFAGGLPSPESFPVEQLKQVVVEVLDTDSARALQYSETEGDKRLREILVEKYRKEGLNININNLIISTASQQALDLIPKIFVNPGDKVICGLPSYLGGISAFATYGADLVGIELDDHGMRSDLLEQKMQELQRKGQKPKFIYVIPDFQNPTGICMPERRRLEIIEIARKYNVLIVEDSPYREVRFSGTPQRTMYELDGTGQVILLGTMSKIFVPGFRLGWIVAHEEVIDKLVVAKQNTDLCTSSFVQKIAAKYFDKGYFEPNLAKTNAMYKEKRDAMVEAFHKFMPKGVKWTEPEGGLFLFVTLPEYIDAEDLFKIAIEENVAFVPGTVFYCNGEGKNTLRINFSFMSKELNIEGSRRLANAIKRMIKE